MLNWTSNWFLLLFCFLSFFPQVTDMMLQEKLYPKWAPKSRKWWNTGYNRIFTFWIAVVLSFFTVVCAISIDVISWDRINGDVVHMDELSRAFFASFILILDVVLVMQVRDGCLGQRKQNGRVIVYLNISYPFALCG